MQELHHWLVLRGGRVGAAAVPIGLVLERHRPVARRQLHGVPGWLRVCYRLDIAHAVRTRHDHGDRARV